MIKGINYNRYLSIGFLILYSPKNKTMILKTMAAAFFIWNNLFLITVGSETEVMEADRKLNQLILQNKANEAEVFYLEDFILITAAGRMVTKKEILAEVASPELKFEINETYDVKVRVHENTAVLTAILHQKGSYLGKAFDAKLWVTDTWIKTGKGWKLLSGQAGAVKE
jgi:hypothetical protein